MFTRKDYMEHKCSHQAYYAQLVTPGVKAAVKNKFGPRLVNSNWPFNDIPLAEWDKLIPWVPYYKFKELGDSHTRSGAVCVLKAAAQQLKEKGL